MMGAAKVAIIVIGTSVACLFHMGSTAALMQYRFQQAGEPVKPTGADVITVMVSPFAWVLVFVVLPLSMVP